MKMRKKNHQLSRRMFLGGAGAAVALPFLPSAIRGLGRAFASDVDCSVPRRLIAWYVPDGIHMADWTPATEGAGFALTPILAPLAGVQNKVNVLTGLANTPARPDGPGDHASGTGAFLTAAHPFKTEGADISNGISMDQVAAECIGACTRFPSLQLGIDGGSSAGGCDSGYSCAYARNISWSGPSTPLPKIVNPQVVFDRLFAGFDSMASAEELAKRRAYETSVLDYALEDANQLRVRLGAVDQRKLDEYLNAIREVEMRIAGGSGPVCVAPDRPPADLAVEDHIDLMSDLQVLALQCDTTRIITFMMANAGSGRNYDFIGAPGGHHELSHHDSDPAKLAALSVIDTWEVARLAYFLEKLDAVTEADGSTLLDNSAVFFSSEISDGNRHNHDDMPILLAGSGGGAWTTGRHARYAGSPTVANLFIAMLHSADVMVPTFGNGTEPLTV